MVSLNPFARVARLLMPDRQRYLRPATPIGLEGAEDRPLAITGHVIDPKTLYPLDGVTVSAELAVPDRDPVDLGSSVSNHRGEFRIDLGRAGIVSDPTGKPRPTEVRITVLSEQGRRLTRVVVPVERVTDPVTIHVAVERRPPAEPDWRELAQRMEEARLTRLADLALDLMSAAREGSLVPGWDRARRHGALFELEQTLLDPTGVLRQSTGIALPTLRSGQQPGAWSEFLAALPEGALANPEIRAALDQAMNVGSGRGAASEWEHSVDLAALGAGDLGHAVFKVPGGLLGPGDGLAGVFEPPGQLATVPYRDYLRDIYVDGGPQPASRLAALERRFHQDFTTTNTTSRPLNMLLVGIVTDILTSPTGTDYGLGIDPAMIPEQGDLSHRAHLDQLTALSGFSPTELGRRYRLDLDRPDTERSSRVQLNVDTLQGFYRDGYQSRADPDPIINQAQLGKAPFFLYFEEWQARQQHFYAENHWDLRRTFRSRVSADQMENFLEWGPIAPELGNDGWFGRLLEAETALIAADRHFDRGEYGLAQVDYGKAATRGLAALKASVASTRAKALAAVAGETSYNLEAQLGDLFAGIAAHTVDSEESLRALRRFYLGLDEFDHPGGGWYRKPTPSGGTTPNQLKAHASSWVDAFLKFHQLALLRLCTIIVPTSLGDCALAAGDYVGAMDQYGIASRYAFLRAEADKVSGWNGWPSTQAAWGEWERNADGALPWTGASQTFPMGRRLPAPVNDRSLAGKVSHPIERRAMRVWHANAMLEWADVLHRTDLPPKVGRARELYKAVFLIHGSPPPVSPHWMTDAAFAHSQSMAMHVIGSLNPVVLLQKSRALRGLELIDAGLNAYGATDDLVPSLRYRTVKAAADRFAANAKSAQDDILLYLGQLEEAIQDEMSYAHMLEKARLQAEIASEQVEIAKADVLAAAAQVKQIEAAIEAKKEELKDLDDGFQLLLDFGKSVFDAFKPDAANMWKTIKGDPGSSGLLAAVGPAGAVVYGAGLYMYAGISTATSIEDSRDAVRAELDRLQNVALPVARAQHRARQREVRVAELQGDIAKLDARYASELIQFQAARWLNTDFWADLTAVMRRVLHRYLLLGARFAWLAERALAFEMDQPIDIIRLDYYPKNMSYASGADLLQLDLAQLEATRLEALRTALPIRRTFSLAFDFPLQFWQLRSTGNCSFWTSDLPFRRAWPGTYSHRLRAVSVRPLGPGIYRGLLTNAGVSSVITDEGERHPILRPPDAQPISEFSLEDHMQVFGLPDETLYSFEGSGVETGWNLAFPATANPNGLQNLLDVSIEFNARAYYSPEKHQADLQAPAPAFYSMLVVSAAHWWPAELAKVQGNSSPVVLAFDLAKLPFPAVEAGRTLSNLFVVLGGTEALTGPATMAAASPPTQVQIAFAEGIALSNSPPLTDPAEPPNPQPLDQLVGIVLPQVLTLAIDKGNFPGIDFSGVSDVVLGIEYKAAPQA